MGVSSRLVWCPHVADGGLSYLLDNNGYLVWFQVKITRACDEGRCKPHLFTFLRNSGDLRNLKVTRRSGGTRLRGSSLALSGSRHSSQIC
ncbi:hypothetical protein RRG08_038304 [Elysia crispata]|uniref:Uncharacterized protein n=1 Tax=Elysia crispata TaxID=231223 RepID=A0AAE1E2U8_9GAST|nr:hypothetical protein RRG08_038304 [Elysia crispata]